MKKRLLALYRALILILLALLLGCLILGPLFLLLYGIALLWPPYGAIASMALLLLTAAALVANELLRKRRARRQTEAFLRENTPKEDPEALRQKLEEADRACAAAMEALPRLFPGRLTAVDDGLYLPFPQEEGLGVRIYADGGSLLVFCSEDAEPDFIEDRPGSTMLEQARDLIASLLDGRAVLMRVVYSSGRPNSFVHETQEVDTILETLRQTCVTPLAVRIMDALFLSFLDDPKRYPLQAEIFTYDGSGDRTVPISPSRT